MATIVQSDCIYYSLCLSISYDTHAHPGQSEILKTTIGVCVGLDVHTFSTPHIL
jgi:hypothetical protein